MRERLFEISLPESWQYSLKLTKWHLQHKRLFITQQRSMSSARQEKPSDFNWYDAFQPEQRSNNEFVQRDRCLGHANSSFPKQNDSMQMPKTIQLFMFIRNFLCGCFWLELQIGFVVPIAMPFILSHDSPSLQRIRTANIASPACCTQIRIIIAFVKVRYKWRHSAVHTKMRLQLQFFSAFRFLPISLMNRTLTSFNQKSALLHFWRKKIMVCQLYESFETLQWSLTVQLHGKTTLNSPFM